MKLLYYADILEALQRAPLKGPIHIAGGAVRDTILERPIRDIDLFMPNVSIDAAAALLRALATQRSASGRATRNFPIRRSCVLPSSKGPTRPSRSV